MFVYGLYTNYFKKVPFSFGNIFVNFPNPLNNSILRIISYLQGKRVGEVGNFCRGIADDINLQCACDTCIDSTATNP